MNPTRGAQKRPRRRRSRRTGYAETIALVVVAAVLVIIAVVVAVHRLTDVNPIASPTPFPTPTPTPSVSTSPSVTPTPADGQYDLGQAFTQVQNFYSAYGQDSSVLSHYVTPQLAAQLGSGGNSAAGVYCTFNVPTSISYDAPTQSNNIAAVVAHESFVSDPSIAVTLSVSLTTLLITSINCPD